MTVRRKTKINNRPNNIMKTVNIVQQEWKGVTTHWLFGFIYVETSVGKSIWWGA